MKPIQALLPIIALAIVSPSYAGVVAGPVTNATNGHTYYLLSPNSWPLAEAEAVSLGGHLVTIDDAAENNWIFTTFGSFGGGGRAIWIGLDDQAQEGAFTWISGSPSTYRNWLSGEPNNAGNEDFTFMYPASDGHGPTWNDSTGVGLPYPVYGVVEIDSLICTPRAARATAQVVNGFVVGATIVDGGCGYTNAPSVVIQGGDGMGATATAVVVGGQINSLHIVSAGCCYTNPPTIIIGSPPFVPSVGIRVSKVKVSQHVVLGRKYSLDSSSDQQIWAPTGPPFVAESETRESEFDVDQTGRYFRLREVP